MTRFALIIALLAAGCSGQQEPRPIQLGHPAPLTGPDQVRGLEEKQGIALAVEDVNAAEGQVLNRPLQVIHANTGSTTTGTGAVVVRLIQVNKVSALLGGQDVAALDNLGSLSQSSPVPFVLASGGAGRPTGKRVFFTGLPESRRGTVLGQFAAAELKLKDVAILSDGQAARFELIEAFARALSADKLAGRWSYAAPDKVGPVVKELLERKPKAVLFAGPSTDCLEAIRAGLGSIPVLYAGAEGSLSSLQSTPVETPLYLVTAFVAEAQEKAVQEFVARYQKQFGLAPGVHAALAYDDTRLLAAAIKQAETLETEKVVEALHELTFTALTGECKFAKEKVLARPAYVVKLIKGKVEVSKKYE
ncbi:MAG: ABC transporter substrate-binding protein [Gemmataceae bacterium]